MQIAVGGCLAQKDRATIVDKAPWVDVVFGTHNIGSLPALLERAAAQRARPRSRSSSRSRSSRRRCRPGATPPTAAGCRSRSGCNNTCTFCIVPSLRGKEKDRRPGDILAEVEALVAEGVVEVTLLGQNVNTYGVEFGDRLAFGKLLRACGEIEGLERVRFTSPHPAAFTDDVIDAMAETPERHAAACTCRCSPARDRVLKAMRRSYRSEQVPRHPRQGPRAIPDAAITTDIIVGFPGETEEDFAGDARRRASSRASRAPSPSSTPSAPARRPRRWPTRCPRPWSRSATSGSSRCRSEVVLGREPPARGPRRSRCSSPRARAARTPPPHRLSGRARDNRLVHFAVPEGAERAAARRRRRRSASPTARRTTWSPTPASPAGLRRAPHPRRRRVGGPAGRPAARPARGRASGCRRSAARRPCPRRRSP